MAFRMNPKSPLLMKAMGTASPAKNMNKGYGPAKTSSPAKQRSAKNMTPEEAKALNDKSPFGPDGKNVAKPPKSKSKSKYDLDTTAPKKGGKSPAKQTAKQKANLPKEIVNAIAAKSPAKQKRTMDEAFAKRDMKLYGDLNKNEYKKEALRQNKVIKGKKKLYTKLGDGNMQTKKDKFGNADLNLPELEPNMRNTKGQSMNSGNTGGRKITGDVPKTKMKSKTKKVTTLKAEGVKNTKTDMPTAKPIKAKAIKVASKTTAKPDRSQRLKAKSDKTAAKGKKAVDEGKTKKADRLLKRAARQENRSIKKEKRQAGRATKKAAKA